MEKSSFVWVLVQNCLREVWMQDSLSRWQKWAWSFCTWLCRPTTLMSGNTYSRHSHSMWAQITNTSLSFVISLPAYPHHFLTQIPHPQHLSIQLPCQWYCDFHLGTQILFCPQNLQLDSISPPMWGVCLECVPFFATLKFPPWLHFQGLQVGVDGAIGYKRWIRSWMMESIGWDWGLRWENLDWADCSSSVVFCRINCLEGLLPVTESVVDTQIFHQFSFDLRKCINNSWCILFNDDPCCQICCRWTRNIRCGGLVWFWNGFGGNSEGISG